MKKILCLLLASLVFSSCVVTQPASRPSSQPSTHDALIASTVNNGIFIAMRSMKKSMAPETVSMLKGSLPVMIGLIQSGEDGDALQKALDVLLKGKQLDPDPVVSQHMTQAIKDALMLIEESTGSIQLDINGQLSPQQKTLMIALLQGMLDGVR